MIRKLIKIIILTLLLLVLFPVTAYAETEEQLTELGETINDQLRENTDGEVSEIIDEYGLNVGSEETVSGIGLGSVLGKLLDSFTDKLRSPLRMLAKLIAAAMLCSLVSSLTGYNSELGEIYRILGTLAAILAVYDTISECTALIVSTMEGLSQFMLTYIPIYATITVSMGNAVSGSSFYASDLFLCEVIAFLTKTALVPLMSLLTAISVVGAVNPDIKLGNAAIAVKKLIQWGLGIMMTIFTGLMTVQNAVGASSSSLRAKTVRFAASSFIPIIGGAVSESYSALKGSLGVIRTGTGAVGIFVIAVLVLRPLIAVLAVRAALAAGGLFCDILGAEGISALLRELGAVLAIGTSILIGFSMMFIISTSIVMNTALGNGV